MARKSYAPPLPPSRKPERNSDSVQANKPLGKFKPSRPLAPNEKPAHEGGNQRMD